MTTLLEIRNLHVSYGNVEALHGIDLAVKTGEIDNEGIISISSPLIK